MIGSSRRLDSRTLYTLSGAIGMHVLMLLSIAGVCESLCNPVNVGNMTLGNQPVINGKQQLVYRVSNGLAVQYLHIGLMNSMTGIAMPLYDFTLRYGMAQRPQGQLSWNPQSDITSNVRAFRCTSSADSLCSRQPAGFCDIYNRFSGESMTLTADTAPTFRAFRVVLAGGNNNEITEGLGFRCAATCNTDVIINNPLRLTGTDSICGGNIRWDQLANNFIIPPPLSTINNAMLFRDLQNGFGQFNWRAPDDVYWADIESSLGGSVVDDSPCDTMIVNHGLVDSCEAFVVNGMVHPIILHHSYMGGGRGEPGLRHIVSAMMPSGGQRGICNLFFGALSTFTAQCETLLNLLPHVSTGWDWARHVRMGGPSVGRSGTITIAAQAVPLIEARPFTINCEGRPTPGDVEWARRCILPLSNALLHLRYVQQAVRNVGRCYLPPVFQLSGNQADLFLSGCFSNTMLFSSIGRRTDYRAFHMTCASGCGCNCVGGGPCGGACGNHNAGIVGAFNNVQQIQDILYATLPTTTDANFPHALSPMADFPPQRFANGLVPGTDGFAATCADMVTTTGCVPPINDFCGFDRQESGRWDSLIRNNEGPFQSAAYVLDSSLNFDSVTGTFSLVVNDGGGGIYGNRMFTVTSIPPGWSNVLPTVIDASGVNCITGTFAATTTGGYRNGVASQYFIWPVGMASSVLMASVNPWLKGDRIFTKPSERVYVQDGFLGIINVVISSYNAGSGLIETCNTAFSMQVTMAKEIWSDTPKNIVEEDVNYVDALDCFISFCGPDKWKGIMILVIIVIAVLVIGIIIISVALKAYAKSRTA